VRAFSFAFGGLRAAVKVHNTLLYKLINAPVQFFDQTPGGRILNRLDNMSSGDDSRNLCIHHTVFSSSSFFFFFFFFFWCFYFFFVICRLSSDLYTIDDSLPFILNILLANFVGLLGIAVVLSYVQVHIKFFHFACVLF